MKKYFLFIPLLVLLSCKEPIKTNNNSINMQNELTEKSVHIQTQNLEILNLKVKISELEKELKKCDKMLNIIEEDGRK